ncbi:protein FAM187B-like [Echinops telfairi]|uniref:Protein FAM187B-like n=1 Tax=Echinops telfairi TaxID=9371 RepID=A0ABM0J6E5_ECHTE|nr:protein FAM187B-like [Echinops telfairi]
MAQVVPGGPPAAVQSTMLATLGLLLSVALSTWGSYVSISCPTHGHCRRALLSGNDIILRCNKAPASWYYQQEESSQPLALSSVSNILVMEGSILIKSPLPSQTGLYSCLDSTGHQVSQYEIDFQDVTALHVTHKDLDQEPLQKETLSLDGRVLIFTRWEPWQACNHCEAPGERKRLGYCHVQEPLEEPVPCSLYLGKIKPWSSRIRPELQIETCFEACNMSRRASAEFTLFDSFTLNAESDSVWLTCPLGSIYRPLIWEANNTPLTWQSQLSGQGLGSVLDIASGGRRLRIFQPAIYTCFVQQEFVARFNPVDDPGVLDRWGRRGARGHNAGKAPWAEADPIFKGLKLVLLVGTVLVLAGALFKFIRRSLNRRFPQVLLVK